MYKRKAQVLFVSAHGRAAAPMAAALANRLGADWLIGRAAALSPADPTPELAARLVGISPAPVAIEALSEDLKAWADLIVHFDAALPERMGALPPTARRKHWPLAADAGTPSDALETELRARILGMVGGMRMLARSSTEADD
ncbi:MAG TPA: hypothetical protein ENN42_07215 [Thioalkalivibrio sp.]|nr:hypothetical protein [Thioalkalivibrio sp.]